MALLPGKVALVTGGMRPEDVAALGRRLRRALRRFETMVDDAGVGAIGAVLLGPPTAYGAGPGPVGHA